MPDLLRSYQLERGTLPGSGDFAPRVREAVIKAAINVHAEDAGTPNHEARIQWAKLALENPDRYAARMLAGVCVSATIAAVGGDAKDGDIEVTVSSLVDGYSPYLPAEVVASAAMAGFTEPVSAEGNRGFVSRFRNWTAT